ncbi:hypothetical protein M426DRAFT_9322 [Hypoxylon sp. CI-4A]|nr:hypothetical protein M426DRAFT_9322 [Hypoxylon sp. CI-4A]
MSTSQYHSCEFCSQILLDIDNGSYPGDFKPQSQVANETYLYFDLSLSDLRRAAASSCDLCEWIVSQWMSLQKNFYLSLLDREDTLFLYATIFSNYLLKSFPIDEISHFGLWDGKSSSSSTSPTCLIRTTTPVDVFTLPGDAAEDLIWNRPINSKPGSLENLALARSWLHTCLTSHQLYPKPSLRFIPERMLHVSFDSLSQVYAVRICLDKTPAHYVALSYCWGGDQPYKTTKARMTSGQFNLAWENIPKTLQDAIKITIDLGLEYIWIDSYCIIQDDDDDFALQMVDVPSIYAHSTVTIAASRSSTVSEGFLNDIDLAEHTHLATRLPIRCADGMLGNAFITSIVKALEADPIHYRAWTLQEFFLPGRLLQFSRCQLTWTCPRSQAVEGSPLEQEFTDGWKRGNNPADSTLQLMGSRVIYEERFRDDIESNELPFEYWMSVLTTYTRRRLGQAGDRIWAISGMAEFWSTFTRDDYLAGHWRKSLPNSLLWYISTSTRGIGAPRIGEIPQLECRLQEYLCPSWSWASVQGSANFLYAHAAMRDTRLTLVSEPDIKLTLKEARFGAVDHGYLTVRGKMRDALYYGNFSRVLSETRLEILPSNGTDPKLLITKVFPDAIEPEFLPSYQGERGPIPVRLLEVGCCVAAGKRGPVGLILRETEKVGKLDHRTFRRLGLFLNDKKSISKRPAGFDPEEWDRRTQMELRWFDKVKAEVLVII